MYGTNQYRVVVGGKGVRMVEWQKTQDSDA
jgi:hypothetical protein